MISRAKFSLTPYLSIHILYKRLMFYEGKINIAKGNEAKAWIILGMHCLSLQGGNNIGKE